jgi:hypothetical protein
MLLYVFCSPPGLKDATLLGGVEFVDLLWRVSPKEVLPLEIKPLGRVRSADLQHPAIT